MWIATVASLLEPHCKFTWNLEEKQVWTVNTVLLFYNEIVHCEKIKCGTLNRNSGIFKPGKHWMWKWLIRIQGFRYYPVNSLILWGNSDINFTSGKAMYFRAHKLRLLLWVSDSMTEIQPETATVVMVKSRKVTGISQVLKSDKPSPLTLETKSSSSLRLQLRGPPTSFLGRLQRFQRDTPPGARLVLFVDVWHLERRSQPVSGKNKPSMDAVAPKENTAAALWLNFLHIKIF